MSANAAAAPATGLDVGARLRSFPLRPAEGWVSLLATALMVAVVAGAYVDADWAAGSGGQPVFLIWLSLIGLAFGIAGAKIGWGRWRTHFVGATFAGLLLPLIVGGMVLGPDTPLDLASLPRRLVASLGVVQEVWQDLVIDRQGTTSEYDHYHLVFGGLMWGAGLLAGFTVFGHRRPLDAVVVLGLVLLANMALTGHNQLTLLILFSAAALLLLIRTHVFEEEITWLRRKIGDPAAVGQLYLRGGAVFIAGAVLGAFLLTTTASSAPLQGLWDDLPRHFQGIADLIKRIAPRGGDPVNFGLVGFGSSATTTGDWEPSNRVAFQAQFQLRTEDRAFKWRAGAFSIYTNGGWEWGATRREPTAARDILFNGLTDAPTPVGRREVQFRITPDAFGDFTVVGPNMVQLLDKPSSAVFTGDNGYFTTIESGDSLGVYNVSAMIPVFQDVQGGLTEARLRGAGTDYGNAELVDLYTSLPEGAIGPEARDLLAQVRAAVPANLDPDNPYDLARTMETYFRDGDNFTYNAHVRGLMDEQCNDLSTAECFAIIRTGYCEFYATTMAVLLRESGIPARIAYGFLPGERANDGLEVVQASSAHWWVEVYFPGEISSWVEFDPTGGGVGQPQAIPSGSVGLPTLRPSVPAATFRDDPTPRTPVDRPGSNPTDITGIGPFIAITLILAIGIAALAFAAYRRTPNRPMHPDQAWGSLGRLAARFGLGPRPSQTVYEYAGALGDAVPDARVELTTIARAKVEVAYGKRDLGGDRLRNVALAYHRLRRALLSVVLRRGLRRRKGR